MKLIEAQKKLGIVADGKWGPASRAAICKALPNDNNLLLLQLTPNFTLGEMLASDTAARRGIANLPGPNELKALVTVCEKILEPVRAHYGVPVTVTSGLRVLRLNRAVNSGDDSQHIKGEAVDFRVKGQSNYAIFKWIKANLKFDQLIYEFGEIGWIHCSYGPRMRHKTLKIG